PRLLSVPTRRPSDLGLSGKLQAFALKTAHGRLVAKEDHLAVGLRTDLGADRCLRYGSPAYRLTLLEGDAPAEAATDPEPTLADVDRKSTRLNSSHVP